MQVSTGWPLHHVRDFMCETRFFINEQMLMKKDVDYLVTSIFETVRVCRLI